MSKKCRAIEHALQRLQLIISKQIYGIVVVSEDGHVEIANQTFCDMFGISISPIELCGLTSDDFLKLIIPAYENPEETLAKIKQIVAAGIPHLGDEIKTRDGRTFLVDFSPIIIDGQPSGRMWQHRDITARKTMEEDLRQHRHFLSELIENSGALICVKDIEGRYRLVNNKWEQVTGLKRENTLNRTDLELFPAPFGQQFRENDLEVIKAGKMLEKEEQLNDRYYLSIKFPLLDEKNKIGGICGMITDITSHKQTEDELATQRQRLAYILEGTNVGTWEWNVQTGETIFNERWADIIGYTLAELSPLSIETWMKFAHPDDLKTSGELLQRHFSGEIPYYECEARMRHKDGRWVWVLDRGRVATWTPDHKPLMMSGTHQEITQRKLAEEQVQHLATHDLLTGLPTMRLAKDRLQQAMNLARRHDFKVAMMFLDLDGFKAVNDSFGHDVGDYVLKEIASRILTCLREADSVCRYGGDEFVVIATGLRSADNAALIAQKIISVIEEPVSFEEKKFRVHVGVSIGIALFPDHHQDIDQLIKLADDAMYKVKKSGKNNFEFAPSNQ